MLHVAVKFFFWSKQCAVAVGFGTIVRQNFYPLVLYAGFAVWSNQIKSNYFIVRLKVDQRAGKLSLPHLGITKTEKIELKKIELKHKTDEQISPVNSLEPWDQSDRQEQTKVEDKIFWKGRF